MEDQWKEVRDVNNRKYYWNVVTNETSWDLPSNNQCFLSDDSFESSSNDEMVVTTNVPNGQSLSTMHINDVEVLRVSPQPNRTKCFVTVVTGNKMFSGTSHDLNMTFTDSEGLLSAPIKIRNDHGELFQKDTTYQKEIGINYKNADISKLMISFKKLRIWINGKRITKDSWYLKEIRLLTITNHEETKHLFSFKKWVEYDTKYESPEINQSIDKIQYKLSIHTGIHEFAGTDATIMMNLIGTFGDTGMRKLRKSETHLDKFESGHEDIFKINAVDIGDIQHVILELHNKPRIIDTVNGVNNWLLAKICVQISNIRRKPNNFIFNVNEWIGTNNKKRKMIKTFSSPERLHGDT